MELLPQSVPWDEILTFLTKNAHIYGIKILGALCLTYFSFWTARRMERLVRIAMERAKIDMTVAKFTSKALRWVIIIAALVAILSLFGVETTSFAAVLAASGLAIGLAFQGSLANLAAGLMLLIFRPFRVGHLIKCGAVTGIVDEIGLFATAIDTIDKRRIICPNAQIFGSTIENVSHHAVRRVDVTVGVDYSAPLDLTKSVLTKAVTAVERSMHDGQQQALPDPEIVLSNLGTSSVDWTIRVWVLTAEYLQVHQGILWQVKTALDETGISIPFPQVEVHIARTSLSHLQPSRSDREEKTKSSID